MMDLAESPTNLRIFSADDRHPFINRTLGRSKPSRSVLTHEYCILDLTTFPALFRLSGRVGEGSNTIFILQYQEHVRYLELVSNQFTVNGLEESAV